MLMVSVQSSQLQSIGYDSETRQAHVLFKNGALYEYDAVEEDVVNGIISASSPGQAFLNSLKFGYEYRRIG
jgi:hypothetical protein